MAARDARLRYRVLIDYPRPVEPRRYTPKPAVNHHRGCVCTTDFVRRFFSSSPRRERERPIYLSVYVCTYVCMYLCTYVHTYVALRTSSANYHRNTSFACPLPPPRTKYQKQCNDLVCPTRIPRLMATYRAPIYRLTDYLHYSTGGELKQDGSHASKTRGSVHVD